ncbi:diguanylate cyclase [Marinomonas sp. A79]|uniref:diguanylate cyclase n=1 Tax=Marinomonas vulgaris TaxID=2823372 RepID=A0ABS5H9T0_9GAMM|nr:diguanylate cyclase [Marinomonas vulgaris]
MDNELADILIIDDDTAVIVALNKALKNVGRIRFATDAKQAFNMIEESYPDLILLDVELPDVRGLEVCTMLKNNPETENIPILFITSHTEMGFEEKVFDVGAADYIGKPLQPRVVAARVQTHLDYHRAISLLEKLAHTDSMTTLYNRRTFDEQLIIESKRARREQEPLTVVILDIDEFKKYNDHFGHIEGDECIKQIALSLIECAKRPSDLAARYGGEEFALLLPNTDNVGAKLLLTGLLESIQALNIQHAPDTVHDRVTVSIGYKVLDPVTETMVSSDDWLIVKEADKALYQSKRNGRNRITAFTDLNEENS